MPLNIVVCIKQVANPNYFSQITLDPQSGAIQRDKVPSILNPLDEHAIEEALKLRDTAGGKITAISMGPPQAKEVLEWAMTLGVDQGILLCDRAFAAGDSLATASVLAAGIKALEPVDIVFCGNESVDGATQQVGPQLAELLDWPHIGNAKAFVLNEDNTVMAKQGIEHGYLKIEATLPVLVSVAKEINVPRQATAEGIMSLMDKVYKQWGQENIAVDEKDIGLAGSPTKVGKVREQKLERQRLILEGSAEEMVDAAVTRLREEELI